MLGFVFASRLENEKEILDDFSFDGKELQQNLKEIGWLNRLLGGDQVVFNALESVGEFQDFNTIVDIGTGSGELLAKLSTRYNAKIIGWEANPSIVELARKNVESCPSVSIIEEDVFSQKFQDQTQDVLLASLFLHHFSEAEIIDLLLIAKKNTRKAIIINDLHRSMLAYNLFRFVTFITNSCYTTKHDGKISILKGFTKEDWARILKKVGIKNYSIKWKWAFRYQIIVHCNE